MTTGSFAVESLLPQQHINCSVRESRLLDRPPFLISSMNDEFENGGELEITEFEIADGK